MSTTEDETRSVLMCRSRTLYLGSRSDRACFDTHFGGSTQRTRPRRGTGGRRPDRGRPDAASCPASTTATRRRESNLGSSLGSSPRGGSRDPPWPARVAARRQTGPRTLPPAGRAGSSFPAMACPMVSAGNTAHAPSSPRHTGRRRAGVTTRTHPCITHAGHSSDGRKHP